MANLSKVIYINEEDYSTLLNGGTITKGGVTYSHDPTALYVIKNVSAPEYAETAGYATTAGQATKAIQDGGGNVISETYAKKAVKGILTHDSQTDTWTCNKTHEELTNAILAGNLVYLTASDWNNQIYYSKRYPYPDGNGDYTMTLLFQSLENSGYCERFTIYNDDSIEYEEIDFESYLSGEGCFKQRTVLKLTIGNNNTLSFKDQNNQNVAISEANSLLQFSGDDIDVVIQYNGLEYHKSYFDSNSSITFSSADRRNIDCLIFDCSNANTVSLVYNGSTDISGIVYGISVPGQTKSPTSGTVSLVDEFNAKQNTLVSGTNIKTVDNQSLLGSGNIAIRDSVFGKLTNGRFYAATLNPTNNDWIFTSISVSLSKEKTYIDVLTNKAYIYDGSSFVELNLFTKDTTPTSGSSNPITSGAVYTALSGKVNSSDLATVATSGSYNDLTNKPTNVSSFTNDSGYQTKQQTLLYINTVPQNESFELEELPTFYDTSNNIVAASQVKALFDDPAKDVILAVKSTDNLFYNLYRMVQKSVSDPDYVFYSLLADYPSQQRTLLFQLYEGEDWTWSSYILDISLMIQDNVPSAATVAPLMDGTADVGTSSKYAKEDHVHPSDTSKVPTSRTINSKALTNDITLTASDVGALPSSTVIPDALKSGSVAGKLYRDDVNGGGNFTVKGNSGCIPNLTAGTFIVSIYAKSETQSYTFRFNFGSVSYDLSTTNSEINDTREITIPSDGTFSGSVLNGSVAPGTILYVVMYDYLTPVSTVGVAAVTNRYSDLDGTPNIPTVNNGTLTIQQNEITVGTFTANQSSNTTANIYSTMFGTLGQSGFERDNYNSIGGWAGVETVTPNPLVTYVDILSNKLYRYDPLTSRYIELSEGDLSTITSTAITDLTDIL